MSDTDITRYDDKVKDALTQIIFDGPLFRWTAKFWTVQDKKNRAGTELYSGSTGCHAGLRNGGISSECVGIINMARTKAPKEEYYPILSYIMLKSPFSDCFIQHPEEIVFNQYNEAPLLIRTTLNRRLVVCACISTRILSEKPRIMEAFNLLRGMDVDEDLAFILAHSIWFEGGSDGSFSKASKDAFFVTSEVDHTCLYTRGWSYECYKNFIENNPEPDVAYCDKRGYGSLSRMWGQGKGGNWTNTFVPSWASDRGSYTDPNIFGFIGVAPAQQRRSLEDLISHVKNLIKIKESQGNE